jgi:predicted dithiol-disulfide oxidoreductase (DUF899 family)
MSNEQLTAKRSERRKNDSAIVTANHAVVSHEKWLAARTAFLAKEKEFTRLRDELSQQRRDLPWEAVSKEYVFEGPDGKQTLAELFDGRSQLIVYHFMFAPDWEAGCSSCSFWADNFDGIDIHLKHRDTTFVAISRAPYEKLKAYRQRMGWSFKWLSASGNDFAYDLHASYTPEEMASEALINYKMAKPRPQGTDDVAISVFIKNLDGAVFHTYSTYSRGADMMNGAYHYLDLTPKGRDEADQKPHPQAWVRRHDEYGK